LPLILKWEIIRADPSRQRKNLIPSTDGGGGVAVTSLPSDVLYSVMKARIGNMFWRENELGKMNRFDESNSDVKCLAQGVMRLKSV
jgi:hypothetical protein